MSLLTPTKQIKALPLKREGFFVLALQVKPAKAI